MDLECRAHEMQALSAATQVDAVVHAILRRRHYETVLLPGVRALLERRSSVAAAAKQVAAAALRGYEELHALEKQVTRLCVLYCCAHSRGQSRVETWISQSLIVILHNFVYSWTRPSNGSLAARQKFTTNCSGLTATAGEVLRGTPSAVLPTC